MPFLSNLDDFCPCRLLRQSFHNMFSNHHGWLRITPCKHCINDHQWSSIIHIRFVFLFCFAHTERTWQINNIDIDRSNILNSNVLSLSLPFRESFESQSELWVWTGEQREQEGMVTSDDASRSVQDIKSFCNLEENALDKDYVYILYTSSNKLSYVSVITNQDWCEMRQTSDIQHTLTYINNICNHCPGSWMLLNRCQSIPDFCLVHLCWRALCTCESK